MAGNSNEVEITNDNLTLEKYLPLKLKIVGVRGGEGDFFTRLGVKGS